MTRPTYGRATLSSWGYLPVLAARPEGWRYEERWESGICGAKVDCRVDLPRRFAHHPIGICWDHYLVMVHQPTGPAQFKVQRGVVRNETGLFHLPVTITNTGGLAVGEVRVEGKLNNQGQEEITVTTIDFLPVRAQEEVVLIFRNEPSGAVVQVVSYQQP